MTDALSKIYREEERRLKFHQILNELSLLIWHFASKYPKGELREEFITDTLETVCERLADRFASFEGDDMTHNGKENEPSGPDKCSYCLLDGEYPRICDRYEVCQFKWKIAQNETSTKVDD